MKTTKQNPSRLVMTAFVITGLYLTSTLLLLADNPADGASSVKAPSGQNAVNETKQPEPPKAELKSEGEKLVNPEIQSEVEKNAAAKRAQLLKDAQSALEETHKAVEALDQGKKEDALAALEKVTGKLDLIVARDPNLALAPVSVATIVRDLYSTPEVAKEAVNTAKNCLRDGNVQQARAVLGVLASEEEVQVNNIPLATYPAAIRAIAPLIDAGKIAEAKAALQAALNTLVVESYITPLPKVRVMAMLVAAERLAKKSGRTGDENQKLHNLIEDARQELRLGEVLGYGTKADYQPLYVQLDEIQKKTEGGKSGEGFFDKIKESLKNFKDHIAE